ncbi:MAG TPA: TonB-dependent receptor [Casimicrobiaceae bacterium]|nr:TonB-dependent receptor [Casimicrobiaceae bacterium]
MKECQVPMRRPLAAAVAAVVAGGVAPALAQDVRVEVTGSNIKRVDVEGALPVTVLSREDIERTGSQSVPELLQYIASNASGGAVLNTNVIGLQSNSVSTASLRALGGQNTLVLVNGKRLTQASGEIQGVYGVNLDSIPFSAIERVEILKDGASAVYGSDAIAGVINFIMRQDFRGAEVSGYYGTPTRGGGGEKWHASGTFGIGELAKDKYNLFVNAYYQKAQSLDQNKRNFSRSSIDLDQGLFVLSGHTFPAHVATVDGIDVGTPGFPDCGRGTHFSELDDIFGPRCFFDPAAADGVMGIPKTETTSLYASGRWQFHPEWQLYGTAAYTKVDTRYRIQPLPISEAVTWGPNGDRPSTILLQPTNPNYPHALAQAAGVDGQPLSVFLRGYVFGLRDTTDENEALQTVVGTKGSGFGWDWDASFAYSRNETRSRPNGGFVRPSEVLPILNSDQFNPFGPQTPAVQQQLDALQFRDETLGATSSGYMFEAKGTGDLFKMPAGMAAAAVGVQVGRSELEQRFHPALQEGDVTGFGGNSRNINADRDFWAAFAEINVPLVKNLELNAAVRYDDYSDFGSTTNPKVSLRWTPVRELLVRGSWGTGFVAPTLTQAYGANIVGLSEAGLDDPLRCPTTGAVLIDCAAQFNVLFGGNANLKPQKSDQWTVGFIYEPVTGVSVGFDWFNLKVKDLFSNGPAIGTILNDLGTYGYLVTRGPVDPNFPTLPGRITSIDQRFVNIGEVRMDGFDVDLRARTENTRVGRFLFSLNGTYYRKYDVQQTDGSFAGTVANQLGASTSGLIPRYKQYATITWESGPWSATLGNLHQNGYTDVGDADIFTADIEPRRVGTLSLWDLSTTYKGFKNLTLTLGVQNLFDRDPPFTNQTTSFQVGYDPTYYDARARFVYLSATYAFK